MIKIISLPKPKYIKCKMCKCKFSYEAGDVEIAQFHRLKYYYNISVVKCPVCGNLHVTNYGDRIYIR